MVLDFMRSLKDFLRFSKRINESIEEIHPRKINRNYLAFVSGKITYGDLSGEIEESLFRPNWDMLDRGRSNLRPLLFLLCVSGMGKSPEKYVKYASALEMIHNGTLIHDDIEDDAEIRRGDKPIYLKYGLDIAVNSANLLYFSPFLFFKRYPKDFSRKVKLRAYDSLLEHLNRVTWGQGIDIYWHNQSKIPSVREYLQMCCYKTGAIDRMVFSLAGILSKKNDKTVSKLEDFGERLGICLQIHDDFSDVCSINKEKNRNKSVGNDISEGKKSLVNILALQKLNNKDKGELLSILSEQTHDKKKILQALELIKKSGSLKETLEFAGKEFNILKMRCVNILNTKYGRIMQNFLDAMKKDMETKYLEVKKNEQGN